MCNELSELIKKMYKNKYYIYEHEIDNEVFYVGKGCSSRAIDFSNRNEKWISFVNGRLSEIKINIISSTDDSNDAEFLEAIHIKKLRCYGVSLTNIIHNNDNTLPFPSAYTDIKLDIPEEYMGIPLNAEMKRNLCYILNVYNVDGYVMKWPTIKKKLIGQGYNVKERTATMNGKRNRVSVITESDLLCELDNMPPNAVYSIDHMEQIREHLRARLDSFIYSGYKGIAFASSKEEQREISKIAMDEGYNPIMLWSVNNEEKMSEEQLNVRNFLLISGRIPEPYNLLIVTGVIQEDWQLLDPKLRLAIFNTDNANEQAQLSNKIKRNTSILIYQL